ncbi:alpha-amylase domain-containing protein [Sphingobium sp. YR768]|uniref:alpha-amylase domain-containing protein n=1 Tax=Sphingobium sp. YR768 TaxID=1884365 RepID=UPI0035276F5A
MRHGTAEQAGCILLVSNGAETTKIIELGTEHAGVSFRDFLGDCEEEIAADDAGKAALRVNGGSVSLWVRTDSQG